MTHSNYPKVSVVIPTHNRPELLRRSILSVLHQTYENIEVIVVDDGVKERAKTIIEEINDLRLVYIQHEVSKGGGAARNTGIARATGEFVAFQDDDDEWLPEKLMVQMSRFAETPPDVGFCFSAVTMIYPNRKVLTDVPDGVDDYFELALGNFRGFLNVTLLIKRAVFEAVGVFDEALPSHQETDLVLRMAKHYRGLGLSQPLVNVNMLGGYERTGGQLKRRIAGREIILKKHYDDFAKDRTLLALEYFWLGLFYRDDGQFYMARYYFKKALFLHFRWLYARHYASLLVWATPYRLMKFGKQLWRRH